MCPQALVIHIIHSACSAAVFVLPQTMGGGLLWLEPGGWPFNWTMPAWVFCKLTVHSQAAKANTDVLLLRRARLRLGTRCRILSRNVAWCQFDCTLWPNWNCIQPRCVCRITCPNLSVLQSFTVKSNKTHGLSIQAVVSTIPVVGRPRSVPLAQISVAVYILQQGLCCIIELLAITEGGASMYKIAIELEYKVVLQESIVLNAKLKSARRYFECNQTKWAGCPQHAWLEI